MIVIAKNMAEHLSLDWFMEPGSAIRTCGGAGFVWRCDPEYGVCGVEIYATEAVA